MMRTFEKESFSLFGCCDCGACYRKALERECVCALDECTKCIISSSFIKQCSCVCVPPTKLIADIIWSNDVHTWCEWMQQQWTTITTNQSQSNFNCGVAAGKYWWPIYAPKINFGCKFNSYNSGIICLCQTMRLNSLAPPPLLSVTLENSTMLFIA